MFNKKNDPLVDSVRAVMEQNELFRQIEQELLEEYGVESRKALPHEILPEFDAILAEAKGKATKESWFKRVKPEHREKMKEMYGDDIRVSTNGSLVRGERRHVNDYGHDAYELVDHSITPEGNIGPKVRHTKPSKKFFRAEYDPLDEAKKCAMEGLADKDYDKDGKIESPKDEVWGSRLRAAKKAGKIDEESDDEKGKKEEKKEPLPFNLTGDKIKKIPSKVKGLRHYVFTPMTKKEKSEQVNEGIKDKIVQKVNDLMNLRSDRRDQETIRQMDKERRKKKIVSKYGVKSDKAKMDRRLKVNKYPISKGKSVPLVNEEDINSIMEEIRANLEEQLIAIHESGDEAAFEAFLESLTEEQIEILGLDEGFKDWAGDTYERGKAAVQHYVGDTKGANKTLDNRFTNKEIKGMGGKYQERAKTSWSSASAPKAQSAGKSPTQSAKAPSSQSGVKPAVNKSGSAPKPVAKPAKPSGTAGANMSAGDITKRSLTGMTEEAFEEFYNSLSEEQIEMLGLNERLGGAMKAAGAAYNSAKAGVGKAIDSAKGFMSRNKGMDPNVKITSSPPTNATITPAPEKLIALPKPPGTAVAKVEPGKVPATASKSPTPLKPAEPTPLKTSNPPAKPAAAAKPGLPTRAKVGIGTAGLAAAGAVGAYVAGSSSSGNTSGGKPKASGVNKGANNKPKTNRIVTKKKVEKPTFGTTGKKDIASHMQASLGNNYVNESTQIKESFEQFLRNRFLKG